MAVDTAQKRFDMIGLGHPVPSLLPIPDGTIGESDWSTLLWLYSGIALSDTVPKPLYMLITFTAKAPGIAVTAKAPGVAVTVKAPGITFEVVG